MAGVSHQALVASYSIGSATRTYQGSVVTNAAASTARTMTHNGGVRTGKWVVVVNSRRSSAGTNAQPSTVTLAGVGLSLVVGLPNGQQTSSIWISTSDITTDGTDDVVATWASITQSSTQSSLYAVSNLNSTTATDTASGTGATPSLNVDVNAGGLVFGGSANGNASCAWSGVTEDVDAFSGSFVYSSASVQVATAGTPRSVSLSQGATEATAVSASFR